jgi:hypothetical protein
MQFLAGGTQRESGTVTPLEKLVRFKEAAKKSHKFYLRSVYL